MEANLITEDYELIKAVNGQEAVDKVASLQPDLVLLDIMMPVLDGFAACERIREFSMVPIIIVTARGEENARVRGLDLGADDYIVKPFSATELLARVRAVLRRVKPPVELNSQCFTTEISRSILLAPKFFVTRKSFISQPQNIACCYNLPTT